VKGYKNVKTQEGEIKRVYSFLYKTNKKFYFGEKKVNIGKIYIKKSYNNIFITLTDLKSKVILCKTAGSSIMEQNKRRKNVPYTVNIIAAKIKTYLDIYKIQKIILLIRLRIKSFVYKLISKLKEFKIRILGMIFDRRIPIME